MRVSAVNARCWIFGWWDEDRIGHKAFPVCLPREERGRFTNEGTPRLYRHMAYAT